MAAVKNERKLSYPGSAFLSLHHLLKTVEVGTESKDHRASVNHFLIEMGWQQLLFYLFVSTNFILYTCILPVVDVLMAALRDRSEEPRQTGSGLYFLTVERLSRSRIVSSLV